MMANLEELQHKNKTLASWTKERVDQVVRVTRNWDNFQSLLSNHQVFLEQQVTGSSGKFFKELILLLYSSFFLIFVF